MKRHLIKLGESYYFFILFLTSVLLIYGGVKLSGWIAFQVLLTGHIWQQCALFLILVAAVVCMVLHRVNAWTKYFRSRT